MENITNFNAANILEFTPALTFPVSCWDNYKEQPTDDECISLNTLIYEIVRYWEFRVEKKPDELGFRYIYNLEYSSDHGRMIHEILLDEGKADWAISVTELAEMLLLAYQGHGLLKNDYIDHFSLDLVVTLQIPNCELTSIV